ncbi:CBO0543 family protein [Paenibacillus germinis]|uniref:CBO0543 family protein n=1 Tax=Paenibacillus germinis TaxID=2654979 RepID=UPI0035E43F40
MESLDGERIVLLYLSRYPYNTRLLKQFVYIFVWVGSFVLIESIFLYVKLLSYHNGWNFGWSILVWIFMFLGLRLHDTKPLWAWLFCLVTSVFLIIYFQIPISTMK